MRVLVCGGRNFNDVSLLNRTLDAMHAAARITTVIHGTYRGADTLAGEWASEHNIRVDAYVPDWDQFGSAAGPKRNARMLSEGNPQLVIAFAGGRGTADMVKQAKLAGVPVKLIPN